MAKTEVHIYYDPMVMQYSINCVGQINGERHVAQIYCEHEKDLSAASSQLIIDFDSGKIPVADDTPVSANVKSGTPHKRKASNRVYSSASSSLNSSITTHYASSSYSDTSASCIDGGIC